MSREYSLYLSDILEALGHIQEYIKGMTYKEFVQSKITIDAVIRNLEVIREAADKLPSDVRNRAPDIEWRKIMAMRTILTHEYFGASTQIVWDVIQDKIEQIGIFCQKLMDGA